MIPSFSYYLIYLVVIKKLYSIIKCISNFKKKIEENKLTELKPTKKSIKYEELPKYQTIETIAIRKYTQAILKFYLQYT